MADKAEPKDPRTAARDEELERQAAVREAVHDRTHGKDGKPRPIVP
jgi:hypothetical protein